MPCDDVVTSLEHVAERAGDIAPEIYRRFAARAPQAAALMSHMDEFMVGRMMQDVLLLLMTRPDDIERDYLKFEVGSHRSYGTTPQMFLPLLEAVRDTVREHLGSDWSAAFEQAWSERITALVARIEAVAA